MEDYYEKKLSKSGGNLRIIGWCFVGTIFLLMAACFTSCKTIQYVPVPEYHHDSIYITKYQRDSIFQHDSVYVKEYTNGDTVYLETTKWMTKYKEVYLCDTMFVEKTDSVRVPYPVEKKLTKWQQLKVDWGGEAIIIMFIIFAILVYLVIVRLRK